MLKEHPAVADAVVVGVPDDEWGEIVAAVVATTGRPSRRRRARRLGRRAARRATSGRVAFVFADEVGRTTVGKLDYEWARRALSVTFRRRNA